MNKWEISQLNTEDYLMYKLKTKSISRNMIKLIEERFTIYFWKGLLVGFIIGILVTIGILRTN